MFRAGLTAEGMQYVLDVPLAESKVMPTFWYKSFLKKQGVKVISINEPLAGSTFDPKWWAVLDSNQRPFACRLVS